MVDARQPSFGTAFVSALAGGAVSAWISTLFVGLAPGASTEAWAILTSVFGAVAVKVVLRILRYDCPFALAAGALLAGRVAALALVQAMPDLGGHPLPVLPSYGLFSSFPSLLLTAWVVQISAARTRSVTS